MTTGLYMEIVGCVLATLFTIAMTAGLGWFLFVVCHDLYKDYFKKVR